MNFRISAFLDLPSSEMSKAKYLKAKDKQEIVEEVYDQKGSNPLMANHAWESRNLSFNWVLGFFFYKFRKQINSFSIGFFTFIQKLNTQIVL